MTSRRSRASHDRLAMLFALLMMVSACGSQGIAPAATLTAPAPTGLSVSPVAQATVAAAASTAVPVQAQTPGARSQEPGGPAPQNAPATAGTGPTPLQPAEPDGDLLKRRDAPPAGVAEQVKYFGGAGGVCVGQPEAPLLRLVSPRPGEIEIGTRVFLCSEGFADAPSELEVALPDGTLRHGSEHPANFQQGTNLYFWTLLPDDPTGPYTITVIQGERRAQITFDVAPASRPRFLVRPGIVVPGSGVRFDLVGYPPDSDILLYVYKLERSGNEWYFHFGTTLPPAHTDSRGIATYTLPTQPDDEDGEYLIVTEPPGITPGASVFANTGFYLDTLPYGTVAITRPGVARDLWVQREGGERMFERPKLYGGALVTVLAKNPGEVLVRTPEGVEGWIREAPTVALTADTLQPGEAARFVSGRMVRIVWANGIPLRASPRSDAAKLRERLDPGQTARLDEVRGDWLRITLDDGTQGWARWYYDEAVYIEPEVRGQGDKVTR